MVVSGPSMSPLLNGDHKPDIPNTCDRVLVNKIRPSGTRRKPLERGMVIAFVTPHDPEKVALKRIIAVAGDVVKPRSKDYPGGQEEVVVPYNHLWIEGDAGNDKKSVDSNVFGPISEALVVGEATAVLYPFRHAQRMDWKTWKGCDRVRKDAMKLENPDDKANEVILERVLQSRMREKDADLREAELRSVIQKDKMAK
ncbi:MAG: hypothetical protein Q9227_009236 [Pyrenula ochraceoflavens]